eukprot:13778086-Heterocapsa_arctica.AAC.1
MSTTVFSFHPSAPRGHPNASSKFTPAARSCRDALAICSTMFKLSFRLPSSRARKSALMAAFTCCQLDHG